MSDDPKNLPVTVKADLKYIEWVETTSGSKLWTATGLIEFDVVPTLLVVPKENCTITWTLSQEDGGGKKGNVAFADPNGVVWNADQPGGPGQPTRVSNTEYTFAYDNSQGAAEVEWHYTINIVLSKESKGGNTYTDLPAQCDPDVENEPPSGEENEPPSGE